MRLRVKCPALGIQAGLRVDVENTATLADACYAICQVLPTQHSFKTEDVKLSLNGKTPIQLAAQEPLTSAGIRNGDLVWLILPESNTATVPQAVTQPTAPKACANGHVEKGIVVSCVAASRTDIHLASDGGGIADIAATDLSISSTYVDPSHGRSMAADSTEALRKDASSTAAGVPGAATVSGPYSSSSQPPIVRGVGAEGSAASGSFANGASFSSRLTNQASHVSQPGYLDKVLEIVRTSTAPGLELLAGVVHAAMLDAEFSSAYGDDLPAFLPSGRLHMQYAMPSAPAQHESMDIDGSIQLPVKLEAGESSLEATEDAPSTSQPASPTGVTASVDFIRMGNFLIAHGHIHGRPSEGVFTVYLSSRQLSNTPGAKVGEPLLKRRTATAAGGSQSSREMVISVKDQLVTPLLIRACDMLGKQGPPSLLSLPVELMEKILLRMRVIYTGSPSFEPPDVAALGMVNKYLKAATCRDDLWQKIYEATFGLEQAARDSRAAASCGWKELCGRKWKERRSSQTRTRVAPVPFHSALYFPSPYPAPGRPRHPGILGGNYDRLPGSVMGGYPHMMPGRSAPLNPMRRGDIYGNFEYY